MKRKSDKRIYPCAVKGCKVMRNEAEGGTTFTVCDKHWDEFWEGQAQQKSIADPKSRTQATEKVGQP